MPRKVEQKPALNRRERAQATRQRMLDAAYATFSELGYRVTTMNEVARRADVAVQTVYFTFHTKAALLTETVVSLSAGGDAGTPVMERAWMKEVLSTRDAQRALALIVEHGTDIFRRMAPLWSTMVSAASEDRDFARRFEDIVTARRRGMGAAFQAIAAKDGLKPHVSAAHAADTLFLLQNPQLLSTATTTLGWSLEQLKAWCFLRLLPLMRSNVWRPAVTDDLSFRGELALQAGK